MEKLPENHDVMIFRQLFRFNFHGNGMNAWICVMTDTQRENCVRVSYVEQDPVQWAAQQPENWRLQYAVQGQNPHRAKWQAHQHLHLCKCLPEDKHDDWFECALHDAIMVAQWASGVPRLAEIYVNDGVAFQQAQIRIQQKAQQKARLVWGLKYGAIVVVFGGAFGAFLWWWRH